jgi:preprotein translocase subunit YajC
MPTILFTALVAATKSKSNSSAGTLLLWVVFIAFIFIAWRFFFRPRSQQAQNQRALLQALEPGDEVLTGSGIFGTVVSVEEDRVTIETAPGTHITVLRSTIARRTSPVRESDADMSLDGSHDHVPGYFDDVPVEDDDRDVDKVHGEHEADGEHSEHGGEPGQYGDVRAEHDGHDDSNHRDGAGGDGDAGQRDVGHGQSGEGEDEGAGSDGDADQQAQGRRRRNRRGGAAGGGAL